MSTTMSVDLSTSVGTLSLKNPVTVASGTFGYGLEFADFYDPSLLGGMFLKGLTVEARQGNLCPRLVETSSGLINSIGLQNIGIDEFCERKWHDLEKIDSAVCLNLSGASVEEFVLLARKACTVPIVRAIELNISCPNIKKGGVDFGRSPGKAREITSAVAAECRLPLLVKLTPNVTDIVEIAAAVMDSGATGVTLVNTFLAMAIDAERRRPVLDNVMGGLSGPAIKPIALRMVWQVWKELRCPIIGMGGIMSGTDAIEFMLAGASAISIGTANFVTPTAGADVLGEIRGYCERHGVAAVRDLIGAAHS